MTVTRVLYGWATLWVAIDVGTCTNHRFASRHLCVYKWRENPIYIAVRGDRMVSFIMSVPSDKLCILYMKVPDDTVYYT